MLHDKFEEEDFLSFSPHTGMMVILVMWSGLSEQIFNQPLPRDCIINLIENGPAVSEEKLFESVNKLSILMTLTFGIHKGASSTFFHITDYYNGIWLKLAQEFQEEKLFEKADAANNTDDAEESDDGRRTSVYTISFPGAFCSGELKITFLTKQKRDTLKTAF